MINTQETSQITKIYLVTNCFGDPNKVYIGKTKGCRISSHKRKFGKDIIFTYIDKVNSLESRDWKPLECFWIEYFKFLGFDVQNKNNGGGGCSFLSNEVKTKMSIAKKGKSLSEYHKFKLKKPKSPEARLNMKKTEKFKTQRSVPKSKETILKLSKPRSMEARLNMKYPKSKQHILNIGISHNKPILQYDLEGNFIKEWESITKASIELNICFSGISKCCRNKITKSGKYIWKFKNKNNV